MAHLQYYSYKGIGEENRKNLKYNQVVRIGDRLECSGQGGWLREGPELEMSRDLRTQIEQAFSNVDYILKDAGGKGWSQVFRVNSYHVPLNTEAMQIMAENFVKWMPDHNPIWTCVGVQRLGADDMRVEIEVSAHDPEGPGAAK